MNKIAVCMWASLPPASMSERSAQHVTTIWVCNQISCNVTMASHCCKYFGSHGDSSRLCILDGAQLTCFLSCTGQLECGPLASANTSGMVQNLSLSILHTVSYIDDDGAHHCKLQKLLGEIGSAALLSQPLSQLRLMCEASMPAKSLYTGHCLPAGMTAHERLCHLPACTCL